MKKLLSLSLVVLLFAGCDLSNGGGDSDTEPSASLATKDSLLGTWRREKTVETDTIITQCTFNADGTYIELHDYGASTSGDRFYAFKGTYSVDSEGNVTLEDDYLGTNVTSLSIEAVEWVPIEHPNIMMFPFLIVGGNQLYNEFFIADGPVTGIVGTWSLEYMDEYWSETDDGYLPYYAKEEYIFNQDGTLTFNSYESETGSFEEPPDTMIGTYTYSNDTLTMTFEDEEEESDTFKIAIYNNKYLILGDETSTTAYAFLKQ